MALSANEYKTQLKKRYKQNGLNSLNQREILELVLFYSVPSSSVTKCADSLIDHFGSLSGVFSASFNSLVEIPEMTEKAAAFIKLIPEMCSQYSMSSSQNSKISNMKEAKDFFSKQYYGVDKEVVKVAFLNKQLQIIQVRTIAGGDMSSVMINVRLLVSEVLNCGCTGCIIAHNHPQGNCTPSQEDLGLTKSLRSLLQNLNVRLYDHIVIGNDGVWSIKTEGKI